MCRVAAAPVRRGVTPSWPSSRSIRPFYAAKSQVVCHPPWFCKKGSCRLASSHPPTGHPGTAVASPACAHLTPPSAPLPLSHLTVWGLDDKPCCVPGLHPQRNHSRPLHPQISKFKKGFQNERWVISLPELNPLSSL